MKNILCFDVLVTEMTAPNVVALDEAMHDLVGKPPFAWLLDGIRPDSPDAVLAFRWTSPIWKSLLSHSSSSPV
jgi:hypothetical protein